MKNDSILCMEYKELFFAKDYLLLDLEKLELSLRYVFGKGILNKQEYDFMSTTIKMLKAYLITCIKNNRRHEFYSTKRVNHNRNNKKPQTHFGNNNSNWQPSLFDTKNPLPITGNIKVEGLTESLEALKPRLEQTGPKFPFKIPAGTHWNQIIVKFLNDETVEIWVKKQRHTANFKEMGMVGKGNIPEPSEQWLFLKVLAKCNGELSIKDPDAKDKYKKQKQALSESLKSYFSIDYDPFFPYQHSLEKSGNSYKIKLTLIPPPEIQSSVISDQENADELGIHEFLNEQAPQVLE